MYLIGIGVTEDHSKAYSLYKQSADAEDVGGIGGLGVCYENGIGVQKTFLLLLHTTKSCRFESCLFTG